MKRKLVLFWILIISISLIACGKPQTESPISKRIENDNIVFSSEENIEVEEDESRLFSELEPPQANIEAENEFTEESKKEMEEEIEVDKPYSFLFRDVFGKEYETEIKVGFPKTKLNKENFSFENDRTYYEDEYFYSRQGIDVSNKQKIINWKKVKEAGVEFAIIRLGYRGYGSYGDINLDLQFKNNIKNAKAEGIDVGVYFFAQAINEEEALEEAEFVLKNLEGYELELPVVYDPESILKDWARTDDVTGEQFTKNTIAFCERIKEAGYEPMIYANMLWEAFQFDMEALTDYPFWYADYEKLPQTPYEFTMWQYSEKGRVDGINTGVDLDMQIIKK